MIVLYKSREDLRIPYSSVSFINTVLHSRHLILLVSSFCIHISLCYKNNASMKYYNYSDMYYYNLLFLIVLLLFSLHILIPQSQE